MILLLFLFLTRALMRYHAMKMEEINKIIKELWQATYKGNDIDTIEMKSDVETSSTTNKRTYPRLPPSPPLPLPSHRFSSSFLIM